MNAGRLLLALFLPCLLAVACQEKQTAAPEEVIRPVVTMTVRDPVEGRTRSFSGLARAEVETPISFRVGGQIIELPAKNGGQVAAGDLIARIDPRDFQLRVQQLEAELARTEAALVNAAASYRRVRKLYETSSASKQDLDNAKASFQSALAAKDALVQGLALGRQQLDYTTLTAPADGRIASVPVELHQTVAAGTPVAVLASGGDIEIEIGVPERLIPYVTADLEATVVFDALPDDRLVARIIEVGVKAGTTGAYPVRLRVNDPGNNVLPGMSGEVSIRFPATAGDIRVLVPAQAVAGEPGKETYVFVYDADAGTVRKRDVDVGNLTTEGLQIKNGLAPGDIVVIRGVNRIEDGMRVTLLDRP